MAEYIKREDALSRFTYEGGDRISEVDVDNFPTTVTIKDVKRILRDIPATSVAPVVHCKECDLWNDWDCAGRESLGNFVCSCAHWSGEGYTVYTKPDDFCSYGERGYQSELLR